MTDTAVPGGASLQLGPYAAVFAPFWHVLTDGADAIAAALLVIAAILMLAYLYRQITLGRLREQRATHTGGI